ncbi:MAG: DUF58 domain-containing protein [Phycisphaerales bacterium]
MRRRYHLHLPGLLYLVLVVLVGLAAANRPNNLLVWVFAAMLTAVLLSGLISGPMLMRLRTLRQAPRTARVGEPMSVRYWVTNESRLIPVFALSVRELEPLVGSSAFVQHAGPRETVVAETVFWPQRRGPMRFGSFRVETVFPFGLVRKSVRFDEPSECLVLPRIERLRPGALRSLAQGGVAGPSTSSRPGPGSDFLGVREYRAGDSLRHISWRRSAATGELAVIERSVDAPPRLHVVLDLRRATADLRVDAGTQVPRDLEEDAIVLAASLLAQADRDGEETRLSVLGLPSPAMPMRRGHWHLQKQLAVLAALDLDAPRDPRARPPVDRERATVMVVHVDRADLGVGGDSAVHLGAAQLPMLAAGAADAGGEARA